MSSIHYKLTGHVKKQENVSHNQEKNLSVETNLEVTDGEIRYKHKTMYKYIQGFKENHECNEGASQ